MKSQRDAAAPVPGAKQAADIEGMKTWVERAVWSDRMLQALLSGVKGGVWFSLIDKVYSTKNLNAAFEKVRSNAGSAGVDHKTVEEFGSRMEDEIKYIGKMLKEGTYQPLPVKRVWIPKPGKSGEMRPLGIPSVRDRVVQTAIRNVIEPIFEHGFAEHSYGFRPNRGCKDALRRVWDLLKTGKLWVVDADIKSFFDSIPHDKMMAKVSAKIADKPLLALIEAFQTQAVKEADGNEIHPESGTPQGAVISPLLANIYLNQLDHIMAGMGFEMTRYADDFVVQCTTRQEAEEALELITKWMEGAGLAIHPEKTRLVDMNEEKASFVFLGYKFFMTGDGLRKTISDKSMKKVKARIKELTPQNNGFSLDDIIQRINRSLRGFYEYFKNISNSSPFKTIDARVRSRLRAILRKRNKLRGGVKKTDRFRWPNDHFKEAGFISLHKTHLAERAALRR